MDVSSHFHPTLAFWMWLIPLLATISAMALFRWLQLVWQNTAKKREVRSRLQMRLQEKSRVSRLERWEQRLASTLVSTRPGKRFSTIVEQAQPKAQPIRVLLELFLLFAISIIVGALLHRPITGLIIGLVAVGTLFGVFRYLAAQSLLKFTEQLPEVFLALATAQRTANLTQAIHTVSREVQEPAASELATVYLQVSAQGVSLGDALRLLHERQPSPDLEVGINAMLTQAELGGNRAAVLNSLARTIRVRRRAEADIRLATQQVRYEVYIVAGLTPALAFVLNTLNPGYLNPLAAPGIGILLSLTAVTLVVVGIVWTLYLVRGVY